MAVRQIDIDSIGGGLRRSQTEDTLYHILKSRLKTATRADSMRILCNME